jgi:hypothetical protein
MKPMENKEEHLQQLAENNQFDLSDKDSRAYRRVFDVLRKEPEFQLSSNFSKLVLQHMEAGDGRHTYYWFAAAIAGFVITAGVAIGLTGFKPDFGFLKHASRFTGLFSFGAAFILVLQWIDRKIIQRKASGL